jgi:hypothetical protein
MATFEEPNTFPDPDQQDKGNSQETDLDIEIEDDVPEEDRNRKPADPEKVKQLEVEVDDLDKYSKEAKDKLIRMKRVWNDERRRADAAERERQAALEAAQKLHEENKRIRQLLSTGEKEYTQAIKTSSEMQLEMAKKAYKEAYDAGESDKIIEAQQALTRATLELDKANSFKMPPLQEDNFQVQTQQQQPQRAPVDDRVAQWQSENPWFGQDEEMTAAALGLHEKLKRTGVVVGSERYYAELDNTMRKRFPEAFEGTSDDIEVEELPRKDIPKKPSTVVAPASRSTAPKKVRLNKSQVAIANRLGLTPEQYVRELLKLEA